MPEAVGTSGTNGRERDAFFNLKSKDVVLLGRILERIKRSEEKIADRAAASVRQPGVIEAAAEVAGDAECSTDGPRKSRLCMHVLPSGRRCRALALTGAKYCYYHDIQSDRRRNRDLVGFNRCAFKRMPPLEDRASVQIVIEEVVYGVLNNMMNPKRASLALYGLQLAMNNLRHEDQRLLPEDGEMMVLSDGDGEYGEEQRVPWSGEEVADAAEAPAASSGPGRGETAAEPDFSRGVEGETLELVEDAG